MSDTSVDTISLKADEVLFKSGDPIKGLYIVKTGKILITKESQGVVQHVFEINEKEFIGEASIFDQDEWTFSALAKSNSTLVFIEKSAIQNVMDLCPEWVSNIMITLSDRWKNLEKVLIEHRIQDEFLKSLPNLTIDEKTRITKLLEVFRDST